jgi:transcriptional regulator with XRE-family HTH domain
MHIERTVTPESPPHERLALVLAVLPQNQLKVAGEIGVSPQYLSEVKSGSQNLTRSLAMRMEEKYGVSALWLLTGRGELFADPAKAAQFISSTREVALPDGRRADVVLWDRQERAHVVELKESPREAARREADSVRIRMVPVELQDKPSSRRPQRPSEVSVCVRLPQVGMGELFCLPPASGRRRVRADEYLLLEWREPAEWQPVDLDGAVCTASINGGDVGLFELHVQGDQVKATRLEGDGRSAASAPWSSIQVWGRVLMAFRIPPFGVGAETGKKK